VDSFRAVIIDPERRTIEEVRLPPTLAAIRALIPHAEDEGLDHFLLAEFDHSWDEGWVRDSGLCAGTPVHAFRLGGWHDPCAGRVVIVGVDCDSRHTCDARISLAFLQAQVTWLGLIQPEVTWVEEEHGVRAVVTYSRADGR
jgi:hypothetical protein